jgi:predicted CxxxxCH...CXXCH cytochrome family protein
VGELTALADFADTFDPPVVTPPPVCGSCHSIPPTGNAAGAHAVHTALNGVGNTCDNCHPTDTDHPSGGLVNLGFAAKWNAKSSLATDNGDGTCSSIICHGGKKTPEWGSGTINVDTQCSSCHASGTSQYNGYSSGEHRKHVSEKGYACTECHDTTKLQVGHFTNLSTPGFEQSPASTLKSSLNYNNQTCSLSCHGKNHNSYQW